MKKIDLYTFIYNDEDFLPYFLDYYRFVDRMTFIDSNSTDTSLQILKKYSTPGNPTIRITQSGATFWDWELLHAYRNNIWKESKMDIIFFPDLDEIFYRHNLRKFIEETSYDVYEMEGFEMVAPSLPPPGTSILTVNKGVRHHIYNKSTIFRSGLDISFPNAHLRYTPTANINMGDIYLLHYRNMGIPLMLKRRDREKARLGIHWKQRTIHTDSDIRIRFNKLMNEAVKVI